MKEQWIVEAEQNAKDLAKILFEQIADEADDLCVNKNGILKKLFSI